MCLFAILQKKETKEVYDKVAKYLSKDAFQIFQKLYPSNQVNYGNIFNRIFVFSVLLGVDVIHRRDSDVLISSEDPVLYPIFKEMEYIGKQTNNQTIYICGGGYTGEYNLDIESFIENDDYTKIKQLFKCMSIPDEHHDDIIEIEMLQKRRIVNVEKILINAGDYPECGNVSVYKLHRYFPSPTQDLILGSDYFFIDMAIHGKLSLAYHFYNLRCVSGNRKGYFYIHFVLSLPLAVVIEQISPTLACSMCIVCQPAKARSIL